MNNAPHTDPHSPQTEWIDTPWLEEDGIVKLEMIVRKPEGSGPFPVVIFNHGSTGSGRNPRKFLKTFDSAEIGSFFNGLGWMVLYPQRRGRGSSCGKYLEGISSNRLGYSCDPAISLCGADRAIDDLDVVMDHVLNRDDVCKERIVVAGVSRGGALSIAFAGLRGDGLAGVINFSGGWLSQACRSTYAAINESVVIRGATYDKPMLWLHGRTDNYYGIRHCKNNFDSFRKAGGLGSFYALPAGHNLAFRPTLWSSLVRQYLHTIEGGS